MFNAKMILDSLAPNGKRLVTVELTYPRFIHSEILTHRDRARNSASSRAIPWPKMMKRIQEDPVIPLRFGSEQKGMQTGEEIEETEWARVIWLRARDNAIEAAQTLADLGVHKSICNRLTEPFMWITVIMTATEWKNFFRLRVHPDAEIHFQKIAGMCKEVMDKSIPEKKCMGEWHLPFTAPEDFEHPLEKVKRVSVARCARVSYLTHDSKRDFGKDLELFQKLADGSGFGHYSPFEHVATPLADAKDRSGPFMGWRQFRKEFPLENSEG